MLNFNRKPFFEQIYLGSNPKEIQDLQILKKSGINSLLFLDAKSNLNEAIDKYFENNTVIPIDLSSQDVLKYLERNLRSILTKQPIYIASDIKSKLGLVIGMYKILKLKNIKFDNLLQEITNSPIIRYGQDNVPPQIIKRWNEFLKNMISPSKSPEEALEKELEDKLSIQDGKLDNFNIRPLLYKIYEINNENLPSFAPHADTPIISSDPSLEIASNENSYDTMPQIGQYSNLGPIRGAGAVEGAGPLNIFQY